MDATLGAMDRLKSSFGFLAIFVVLALYLLVDTGLSTPIPDVVLQGSGSINGIALPAIDRPMASASPLPSSDMASLMSLAKKAKLTVFKLSDTVENSASGAMTPTWSAPSNVDQSLKINFGCLACRMTVKAAYLFVRSGATEDEVSRYGTAICSKLKLATYRECHGLSELMKKQIVYVFTRTTVDPTSTCSSILDTDCGASMDHKWTVTLPDVPKPKVDPVPDPKPDSKRLRVLHVSDVHLDVDYVVGANAKCGEMLCCRESDSKSTQEPAGTFGATQGCDTPMSTFESLLAHAKATHQIDYVLWTGDGAPHDDWNQTIESQLAVLQKVNDLFDKYFPDTPIFAAVGNHEGNPVNSFPPPFVAPVASMDWLYGPLKDTWSRWISKSSSSQQTTLETILRGGFYSTLVYPGFRIISLNTNYCNNLNWWILLNATDPIGQLQWLVDELQAAESHNEKVHIIAHIPPGSSDCLSTWSANYYRIINRYESTVRGQFFGHTHNDEYQIYYEVPDKASGGAPRPTNVAYYAPSVTSYNIQNPAYRMYTIDGDHSDSTWAVLNHETYYVKLQEANAEKQIKWSPLYNAKDAYQMKSLQPVDWDELVKKLETDDQVFKKYYSFYHRESPAFPVCVTKKCKTAIICSIKSAESGNHNLCKPMD